MGRAKRRRDLNDRRAMYARGGFSLPDRWVVYGRDGHGEPFLYPATGDGQCSRGEAERTAELLTRRGGVVFVRREVWNGPAAAYRVAREGVPNA